MTSHTWVGLDELAAHVPALIGPAITAAAQNSAALTEIAGEIAARVEQGGRLFGFGAGHAYAFAAELCSRAGGIPNWTSMNLDDLRAVPRPAHEQLRDSAPERDPALGIALAEFHGVRRGDTLVLASQSGRNGAAVEMAQWARNQGVYTIGVVSRAHSAAFASRHPSGLKVGDVCDLTLDLCTPIGDAVLRSESGLMVSSTSTIAFALLAQLLNARITLALEDRGIDPRIITSANVDKQE